MHCSQVCVESKGVCLRSYIISMKEKGLESRSLKLQREGKQRREQIGRKISTSKTHLLIETSLNAT